MNPRIVGKPDGVAKVYYRGGGGVHSEGEKPALDS
jgi:hypothetical protein